MVYVQACLPSIGGIRGYVSEGVVSVGIMSVGVVKQGLKPNLELGI